MHRLVVHPGTPQAWEIHLKSGTNLLGRAGHNDFTVEDPSVSGSHCEIQVGDDGVRIRDLGSTNGTFIGSDLIREAGLAAGQTIRLGNVEMAYCPANSQSGSAEAPPARKRPMRVAPPPVPEAASAPSRPDGNSTFCSSHPKSLARYACARCNRSFCEQCVNSRMAGGVARKTCRACGAECVPLQAGPSTAGPPKKFFGQALHAFAYPFRGDGWILLGAGTVLYLLIEVSAFVARYAGMTGGVALLFLVPFGTGYFLTYMQRIVTSTALGEQAMPDWPEFTGMGEVFGMFFEFLILVLISFSPALLFEFLTIGNENDTWAGTAIVPALGFGCIYLPMAFLTFSMLGSVMSANPLLVLPSIARVPKEYAIAVVIFAVILALRRLGDEFLPVLSLAKLAARSFASLAAIVAGRGLSNFLALYLFTVNMRVLGLLYYAKKDRLGWFKRQV